MIDAAGGILAVALRFLAYSATTGALGAWVFGRLVVGRMAAMDSADPRVRWQAFAVRVAAWCTAALALSAVIRLLGPIATVPDASAPAVGLMALRTPWGATLVAQGVAASVASLMLFRGRQPVAWPRTAEVCLVFLAILPPFLAHAGMTGTHRAASVLVDIIHVAAAGGWVGALALLAAMVLFERKSAGAPGHAAALIVAFHRVAVVAAPAVFITGLITAWLRMGVPEGIAAPTYSGLFVAKLLLAGMAGAIGAGHSKLAMRRVHAVALGQVGRSLLSESLVAVLVLMVTAVLVGTAPIG